MTDPSIAAIVARLTPAQRRFLIRLPWPAWLSDARSKPKLMGHVECGGYDLVEDYLENQPPWGVSGMWLRLNERGLAVRAALAASEGGRDG